LMRCREEIAVEGRSRGHVLSRVNECAAQYPSHHHLLKQILATFLRACEYHRRSWRIVALVIVAHPDAEISQDVFGLTLTEHALMSRSIGDQSPFTGSTHRPERSIM